MVKKDGSFDLIKDDLVYDIKPQFLVSGRGSGKSLLQIEMYKQLIDPQLTKGEPDMCLKEFMANHMCKSIHEKIDEDLKKELGVYQEPVVTKEEPEEEWIWVKGYKGMDRNMQCMNGFQYEIGRQHDMIGGVEIRVCSSGLHFCKRLVDVFSFYPICSGNRFFEVEALIKKETIKSTITTTSPYDMYDPFRTVYTGSYDKDVAKSLKVIRELDVEEVFAVCDKEYREWSRERKLMAIEKGISAVKRQIRIEDLVASGYSEAFANYIAGNEQRVKTAMAVGSMPELSMDVKVLMIMFDGSK